MIHALAVDGGGWLATHPRATRRGSWQIDPAHWDGLPDGHTRATVLDPPTAQRLTGRARHRAGARAADRRCSPAGTPTSPSPPDPWPTTTPPPPGADP